MHVTSNYTAIQYMAARTVWDTCICVWTLGLAFLPCKQQLCLGKAFFQTFTSCRDLLSRSHNWGWWLMSSDKTWLTVAVPVHPKDDEWAWGRGLCAGQTSHSILKWIKKKIIIKKRQSFRESGAHSRVQFPHPNDQHCLLIITSYKVGVSPVAMKAFHLESKRDGNNCNVNTFFFVCVRFDCGTPTGTNSIVWV